MQKILIVVAFTLSFLVNAEQKRPNILVILSDDQGYADVSLNLITAKFVPRI